MFLWKKEVVFYGTEIGTILYKIYGVVEDV